MKTPVTRTTRHVEIRTTPAESRAAFANRRAGEIRFLLRELACADDSALTAVGNRLCATTTHQFSAAWVHLVSYVDEHSLAHWGAVSGADAAAWRHASVPTWLTSGATRGHPLIRGRMHRLHADSLWLHPVPIPQGRALLVLGHAFRWEPTAHHQRDIHEVVRCVSMWLSRKHAVEQLDQAKRNAVRTAGMVALKRCGPNVHRRLGDLLTVVQGHTELAQAGLLARGAETAEAQDILDTVARARVLAASFAGSPEPEPLDDRFRRQPLSLRIWVNEPDPAVRTLVARILRGAGHSIVDSERPAEIDLVVGQTTENLANIPLLTLAGPTAEPALDRLPKPFGARALLAAVAKIVEP